MGEYYGQFFNITAQVDATDTETKAEVTHVGNLILSEVEVGDEPITDHIVSPVTVTPVQEYPRWAAIRDEIWAIAAGSSVFEDAPIEVRDSFNAFAHGVDDALSQEEITSGQ